MSLQVAYNSNCGVWGSLKFADDARHCVSLGPDLIVGIGGNSSAGWSELRLLGHDRFVPFLEIEGLQPLHCFLQCQPDSNSVIICSPCDTWVNGQHIDKAEYSLEDGDAIAFQAPQFPGPTLTFHTSGQQQSVNSGKGGCGMGEDLGWQATAHNNNDHSNITGCNASDNNGGGSRRSSQISSPYPSSNRVQITCGICSGLLKAAVCLQPCSHSFCATCLSHHIGSLVQSGLPMVCPHGCEGGAHSVHPAPRHCATMEANVSTGMRRTHGVYHANADSEAGMNFSDTPSATAAAGYDRGSQAGSTDNGGVDGGVGAAAVPCPTPPADGAPLPHPTPRSAAHGYGVPIDPNIRFLDLIMHATAGHATVAPNTAAAKTAAGTAAGTAADCAATPNCSQTAPPCAVTPQQVHTMTMAQAQQQRPEQEQEQGSEHGNRSSPQAQPQSFAFAHAGAGAVLGPMFSHGGNSGHNTPYSCPRAQGSYGVAGSALLHNSACNADCATYGCRGHAAAAISPSLPPSLLLFSSSTSSPKCSPNTPTRCAVYDHLLQAVGDDAAGSEELGQQEREQQGSWAGQEDGSCSYGVSHHPVMPVWDHTSQFSLVSNAHLPHIHTNLTHRSSRSHSRADLCDGTSPVPSSPALSATPLTPWSSTSIEVESDAGTACKSLLQLLLESGFTEEEVVGTGLGGSWGGQAGSTPDSTQAVSHVGSDSEPSTSNGITVAQTHPEQRVCSPRKWRRLARQAPPSSTGAAAGAVVPQPASLSSTAAAATTITTSATTPTGTVPANAIAPSAAAGSRPTRTPPHNTSSQSGTSSGSTPSSAASRTRPPAGGGDTAPACMDVGALRHGGHNDQEQQEHGGSQEAARSTGGTDNGASSGNNILSGVADDIVTTRTRSGSGGGPEVPLASMDGTNGGVCTGVCTGGRGVSGPYNAPSAMHPLCCLDHLPLLLGSLKAKLCDQVLHGLGEASSLPKSPDHARMLCDTLEVLARTTWADDESREAIASANGLPMLATAMQAYGDNAHVQARACMALMAMVRGEGEVCLANQWQLAKVGCVEGVVAAMQAWRQDDIVQLAALLCLVPLALDNTMMQANVSQEGLATILCILHRHIASKDIQTKGLVLLGVLMQGGDAVHDAVRQRVMEMRGERCVVEAMLCHGKQEDDVLWASLFFMSIFAQEDSIFGVKAAEVLASRRDLASQVQDCLTEYSQRMSLQQLPCDPVIVHGGQALLGRLHQAASRRSLSRASFVHKSAGVLMAAASVAAVALWAGCKLK